MRRRGYIESGFYWDPSYMPGLLFYGDPDTLSTLTYNTQPVWGDWAGTNWVGAGIGPYTHAPLGNDSLVSPAVIAGNRYRVPWDLAGCAGGKGVHPYFGTLAGDKKTVDGSYIAEGTQTTTTTLRWIADNLFGGTVTFNGGWQNLSVKEQAKLFGSIVGSFVNATATSMPWKCTSLLGSRGCLEFAAGDTLVHNGASADWTTLHGANGSVVSIAIACGGSGTQYVYSDIDASPTRGIRLYWDSGNKNVIYTVLNGGANILSLSSPNNTVLADYAPHVVTCFFTQALGGIMLLDRNAPVGAACGVCSALAPESPMIFGSYSGGAAIFQGRIGASVFASGLDAFNASYILHDWMLARYGL